MPKEQKKCICPQTNGNHDGYCPLSVTKIKQLEKCEHLKWVISVSTRWGTRKICNSCGIEYKKSLDTSNSNAIRSSLEVPINPDDLKLCKTCMKMTNHNGDKCLAHGKHAPSKSDPIEGELMEQLADIEHDRWAGWQQYVHSKCIPSDKEGIWEIGEEFIMRWNRQINTPYPMLSEKEKESDREQVRRYLPLILAEKEKSYKEGLHQGYQEEANGCFEHCRQARQETLREIMGMVDKWTEDFDLAYKDFPAKDTAIIIKNRINNSLQEKLKE